jgi:hypothetical protein
VLPNCDGIGTSALLAGDFTACTVRVLESTLCLTRISRLAKSMSQMRSARVSPTRKPRVAAMENIVAYGSGAAVMIWLISASVNERGSFFIPTRGKLGLGT